MVTNEELRELQRCGAPRAFEELQLREAQYNAALRYVQGVRDHMLTVDWKSVRYYATLFSNLPNTK